MITVEDAIAMYKAGYRFVVAKSDADLNSLESIANALINLGYPVYYGDEYRENMTGRLRSFEFIRD